jgi:hypothetical protein
MVRSMFLRYKSGTPYGCLAIEVKETELHYQLSLQNPVDRWDRKMAHEIATARLVRRPFVVSTTSFEKTQLNHHDITYAVMMDLIGVRYAIVPGRVLRSAKRWVSNYLNLQD